jgi:ATP-dependent RNA helicase RhlE
MKIDKLKISSILKQSLYELGFNNTTDIQYRAIPPILAGEDVMAIAQTGTGKTAAYAIPVVENLILDKENPWQEQAISCLVMVPTHELAIQVADFFKALTQYTSIEVLAVYGGIEQETQIKKLSKGVDILVATPGRMFDFIKQKHLKITKVKTLILDEADKMLEKGFLKDIQDVLKFLPKKHQTLFFSATISPEIKEVAYSLVSKAIRIQIAPKDRISKNIQHFVSHIDMDDKRFFLERIIQENPDSKIIAFVRTKVRAERVLEAMNRVNIKAVSLHGGKNQIERAQALQAFKDNEVNLLIATDLSARGVDIPNVAFVVNYDLPTETESYVHRVGRTGRGVAKGKAISFCSTEEKEMLATIEYFLGYQIEVIAFSKDAYEETKILSNKINDWKSLIEQSNKPWKKKK